jgi:hypothetical protein
LTIMFRFEGKLPRIYMSRHLWSTVDPPANARLGIASGSKDLPNYYCGVSPFESSKFRRNPLGSRYSEEE